MATIKIMPCLDMKNGRVVKGIHFVDLKEAGDPVENAAFYQREGADELAMLDIAAVRRPSLIGEAAKRFGSPRITVAIDGTRMGYDLEFARAISSAVSVPVVASGGAGKLEDFEAAVTRGGARILLAASVFHFRTLSVRQVKEYLRAKGMEVFL